MAVAALAGGNPFAYRRVLEPNDKRPFYGTTTDEEQALLNDAGIYTQAIYPPKGRLRLDRYLPLDGFGVIAVRRGHHHHALAYAGKMVYDSNTGERWQWVYDHIWASASVRVDLRVTERKAA